MKPPCTERYARWCERTGVNHPLLLDRLRNLIGDRPKELVYDRGNQDANFLIAKASDRNDKNAVFSLVGGMGKTTLYRNRRYSSKPTREISHFQLDGFYIFNSMDFTFSTRLISHFQLERFHISNSRDFTFSTREISGFMQNSFHVTIKQYGRTSRMVIRKEQQR